MLLNPLQGILKPFKNGISLKKNNLLSWRTSYDASHRHWTRRLQRITGRLERSRQRSDGRALSSKESSQNDNHIPAKRNAKPRAINTIPPNDSLVPLNDNPIPRNDNRSPPIDNVEPLKHNVIPSNSNANCGQRPAAPSIEPVLRAKMARNRAS
jgi:hypothetical protein